MLMEEMGVAGIFFITACLSGAAKLARTQRGEKKCCPRERGRKLEHRAGPSAALARWLILSTFSFFSHNTYIYSTERGDSVVKNLGSPRYGDRQFHL